MARTKSAPAVHPFDKLHGTDTSGLIAGRVIAKGTKVPVEDLTAYYGIAPSILQGVVDVWLQRTAPPMPIERTVFYDVGAGKGRALLVASELPFLRVEGVELNAKLAEIAQRNIELWRDDPEASPLAPLVLHHADATKHPLPKEPTLAFLFHPFELKLLKKFLQHIEKSVTEHPRSFDLFYVNAEHDSLLDHHPAWKRMWIGKVPMSTEDHLADLAEIAQQKEYGSTGDELCGIYRYISRKNQGTK